MADLLKTGDVVLHSGSRATWILDCNALSDETIATAARLLAHLVGPFGWVEGVPRGGLRLAAALKPYAKPGGGLLVADDVYTTGNSIKKHLAGREGKVAVLFSRGWVPPTVACLWPMPEGLPT